MATNERQMGMDHLTVVPENFEPDTPDTPEVPARESADCSEQ